MLCKSDVHDRLHGRDSTSSKGCNSLVVTRGRHDRSACCGLRHKKPNSNVRVYITLSLNQLTYACTSDTQPLY